MICSPTHTLHRPIWQMSQCKCDSYDSQSWHLKISWLYSGSMVRHFDVQLLFLFSLCEERKFKKIDCTKRTWQWLKQITLEQTFMNPFIVELLLSDKIHEFHKQIFNADQKTNTELYTISMISRIFFQLDPIKTIKWYGIINDWYSIILGDVLSKRGIWK